MRWGIASAHLPSEETGTAILWVPSVRFRPLVCSLDTRIISIGKNPVHERPDGRPRGEADLASMLPAVLYSASYVIYLYDVGLDLLPAAVASLVY